MEKTSDQWWVDQKDVFYDVIFSCIISLVCKEFSYAFIFKERKEKIIEIVKVYYWE